MSTSGEIFAKPKLNFWCNAHINNILFVYFVHNKKTARIAFMNCL